MYYNMRYSKTSQSPQINCTETLTNKSVGLLRCYFEFWMFTLSKYRINKYTDLKIIEFFKDLLVVKKVLILHTSIERQDTESQNCICQVLCSVLSLFN